MAIETFVSSVTVDSVTGQPLILLKNSLDASRIAIRVGAVEARLIDLAHRRSKYDQPSFHDVLITLVEEMNGKITAVALEEERGQPMLAYFRVECGDKMIILDCKPSDAIAVAVKKEIPIWLSATELPLVHDLDIERQAFRNFVSDLKPSDFKLT